MKLRLIERHNLPLSMKRYLVLFPDLRDIHLIKDVGMIPFYMGKYYKHRSEIATYNCDFFSNIDNLSGHLSLRFIKPITRNRFLDVFLFICFNFWRYDVVQVYHFGITTMLWLQVCKILSFGRIKTYLKLDTDESIYGVNFAGCKGRLSTWLLKRIDLISAESEPLVARMNSMWPAEIKYIPNGFMQDSPETNIPREKSKVILTVGRIGTEQKATDILCEAFSIFAKYNDEWTLEVVGPIEQEFKLYIERFYLENTSLRSRVSFLGPIYDREKLKRLYQKASIFVLPSRWESFGLVYLEAMAEGCYIVSSDIPPARDLTLNGSIGSLFPVNDRESLAKILVSITGDLEALRNNGIQLQRLASRKFSWESVCLNIANQLNDDK